MQVAILAYGSLMEDPGDEIAPLIAERRQPFPTPFGVEFARLSPHRSQAPVLTAVDLEEGDPVDGVLLLLQEGVSVETATRRLWRRETHQVGSRKLPLGGDRRPIRMLTGLPGVDIALYWAAEANYPRPEPAGLARRAIDSARNAAGADRRDGISYLAQVVRAGIRTRLTDAYVAAVLEQTGAADLEAAWEAARTRPRSSTPFSPGEEGAN